MNKTRTWGGKIFILLLAAALTFTPSAPASAATPDTSWYTENPDLLEYNIINADQFFGLAVIVNSGDTDSDGSSFTGKTINLMEDIDLEDQDWTPIGSTPDRSFSGTFDGNNKKITGMNINQSTYTTGYVGLFGAVRNAGTVKNLVVDGNISLDIITTATIFQVGGVVSLLNTDSRVENCGYIGDLTADITSSGSGGIYIGGVVGRNLNSTVKNCYNTGNIATTNSNSVTNNRTVVGGVVGEIISTTTNSTIENCYNTGNVDTSKAGNGDASAGGVVGELTLSFNNVVKNCYNTGNVQSRKTESTSGAANAGGVVGRITLPSSGPTNGRVENCVSLGLRVAASITNTDGTSVANVGRVAGSKPETGTPLSNNKARSDMRIKENNGPEVIVDKNHTEATLTGRHGLSVGLDAPQEDVFDDWDDEWDIEEDSSLSDGLPIHVWDENGTRPKVRRFITIESDESGCGGGGGCGTLGTMAIFMLPALIPLFRRK